MYRSVTYAAIGLVLFIVPCFAEAATFSVVPSSTQITVGDVVRAVIFVRSEGVAINSAEATLNFPTDLLQATSVSTSNSIFSLWVEQPAFSNNLGQITFSGGVPNPGFSGVIGTVLTATFRAKSVGTADLTVSDAAIRANDGSGTDVFTSSNDASIVIQAAQPEIPNTPAPEPVVSTAPATSQVSTSAFTLSVTSPTHPDQAAWYATSTAVVHWELPPGVLAIKTLLSDTAGNAPTVLFNTPLTERTITGLPNGTSYFTMRYKASDGTWSKVASYRLNVDTVAPVMQNAQLTYGSMDQMLEVRAWAQDERSGISRFELTIDDGAPIVIQPNALMGRTYAVPVTDAGTHTASLRAYDGAGNASDPVSATFTVVPSVLDQTAFHIGSTRIPLLWPLALFLFVSLASLVVAVEARYRLHRLRQHLKPSEELMRKTIKKKAKTIEVETAKIVQALDSAEERDALPPEEKRLRDALVSELTEVQEYLRERTSKDAKNESASDREQ